MTSAGGGIFSGEICQFPEFVVPTDEELEIRDRFIKQRGFSKFQMWGGNMPNYDVKTTPLLEVFSVSVHSHCHPCQIYGTIKVTNGLGHAFDLYNREHDNPEFINPYNTNYSNYLSLIRPKDGRVIIPYEYVTVDVDLRDRARDGIVIAKGKCFLDFKESLFTEHGAKMVDGEAGNVMLHYAAFPYALTATVDLLFFSKDDDYDTIDYDPDEYGNDYADYDCGGFGNDDAVVNICGIVAARTNFLGSSSYGDNIDISSILLNVSRDQCVRVKSRTFIELSRSVVAVPAYPISSLQIHVDFKYNDGSRLAEGVLEYPSDGRSLIKKDVVGENGRIRVRVQWGDAYEQWYRRSDLKRSLNEVSTPKSEESRMEELFKRQRHLADPQPSSAVSDWLPLSPVLKEKQDYCAYEKRMQLLEVFSVGIGSNDWKPPFKLYGTIRLEDYCHLFNRDVISPQICYDKIEVKFYRDNGFFTWDDFGIYINLKDVEGNVLIKGQIPWAVRRLDRWYDKRICSLIRGDHGYVAVHYTMISDGVQARVKVFLKRINSALKLPTKFYGSLVARYSNHEYLSSYDKKYYQSLLFESGSDDHVNLKEDGLMPLSKSLVCFPRKSSLVIEADLTIGVDVLQGTVEFSVDGSQSSKEIWEQNYWIDISVEWPGVW